MGSRRIVIVNADDFGQSPGVNRGVVMAHEQGIVTSTSLMVRWPAAAVAGEYARSHPRLSVGLHLDLTESACRDGAWSIVYQVVPLDDAEQVRAEVTRQVDAFRQLVGRDPTHLDAHQHVHLKEPVRSSILEIAGRLGVPVRRLCRVRYSGAFYGQNTRGERHPELVSVSALVQLVRGLPAGITELGCHPGLDDDVDSVYRCERSIEVLTLCDPAVCEAIRAEGIELRSFHQLGHEDWAPNGG
jgi:predicted glycoside hydrolase/deacetylase ChbG (UPF0249 family)